MNFYSLWFLLMMEKGSYRGFYLSLCSPPTTQGRLLPETMSCWCNSVLPSPLFTSKPSPGNLPLNTISLQLKKKKLDFCNSECAPVLRRCALCTSWSISDDVGILSFTLSYTPHGISAFSAILPVSSSFVNRGFSNLLLSLKEEFAFLPVILMVALDSFPRKGRNGNFMPHLQTRGP